MKKSHIIRQLAFILLTCIMSINLLAASKKNPDSYQVELIVFRQNNTEELHQEHWPLYELKVPNNAIQLSSAHQLDQSISQFDDIKEEKQYYTLLEDNKLNYKSIASKIRANSRYKMISHIGWQQPRADFIKAKPIYFTAGTTYNTVNPQESHVKTADADEYANNTNQESLSPISLSTPEISGVLTINLKKFFHSDLELLYHTPALLNESNTQEPFSVVKDFDMYARNPNNDFDNVYLQSFLINQKARTKIKELAYIDHPMFGAIVVIS